MSYSRQEYILEGNIYRVCPEPSYRCIRASDMNTDVSTNYIAAHLLYTAQFTVISEYRPRGAFENEDGKADLILSQVSDD